MAVVAGLQITPAVTADPAKPTENATVETRVDNAGRRQVRVQVSPVPSDQIDKKPEPTRPELKVEDKPAVEAPKPEAGARPSWLPEKFADPMALKTATIELAKKQGAPAYVLRGLEASESGQEVSDAYKEFEKKIDPNAGKPAEKVEEKPPVVEDKPKEEPKVEDKPKEDAPVVKSEADKTYERETFGTYVAEMLDKVGIRAMDLGEEFVANKGKLTEGTYAKFEKAGVAKPFLDAYIKGMTDNAKALAEVGIKEAKDSVGGEAEFAKLATWGSANMTKEQHEVYTAMTSSGSLVAAKEAVRMLKGWHTEANANPPKDSVKPSTGTIDPNANKGYATKAEMLKDFANPLYKSGNKAFHTQVEEKLKYTKL